MLTLSNSMLQSMPCFTLFAVMVSSVLTKFILLVFKTMLCNMISNDMNSYDHEHVWLGHMILGILMICVLANQNLV